MPINPLDASKAVKHSWFDEVIFKGGPPVPTPESPAGTEYTRDPLSAPDLVVSQSLLDAIASVGLVVNQKMLDALAGVQGQYPTGDGHCGNGSVPWPPRPHHEA
jgi:hypothetical protein